MKRLIVFSIGIILFSSAYSQFSISARVDSMPTSKAYLYEFLGDKPQMIDSCRITVPGDVHFTLPPDAHPGLYRIVVGPNNFWDFIFNKENIRLKTHYSSPLDSLKVLESHENTLLVKYMSHFLNLNRKVDAIGRLMMLYDSETPFYNSLQKEMNNLRNEDPQAISKEIIKNHPDTYVASFLKAELNPAVPVGLGQKEELDYVIEHFFDQIDFEDSLLIYSPPLINKVHSYFSLYEKAFPPSETEVRMMKGLDRLMSRAAISDPVFDFILNNLADRYERSEFETFFAYLTETYLIGAGCTDEERSTELSEILASIKKTALGKEAPEIVLPLADGPVILSDIPEPIVMVFFWASWCPGCKEILPDLKNIYQQYHKAGFEIVAISIDKDKSEYNKALATGKYPWINYSELKGWDCSIAYDYGIRATPTMVLLDKDRRIIAKPRSAKMLLETLNQSGLRPIR